jgi:hypothetical protein
VIVLDECIQGTVIDEVARWYRGRVVAVGELRPKTVIKDDAIPSLLARQSRPTFVTTNVDDFWRRVAPDRRVCFVVLPLPDERQHEIPGLLRRLFAVSGFSTKASRMGKVVRLTDRRIQFYQSGQSKPQVLLWAPFRP